VQYINTAKTLLPDKQKASSLETHSITEAPSVVLKASPNNLSSKQKNLKDTHIPMRKKTGSTIFYIQSLPTVQKNAWNLVKELSDKKKSSSCYISGDDRLKT